MVRHGTCPVCRAALGAIDREPIAKAHCPRCEALLWIIELPSGPLAFVRRPGQTPGEFLEGLPGPRLGMSAAEFDRILRQMDSLDKAELLLELEEMIEEKLGPGRA